MVDFLADVAYYPNLEVLVFNSPFKGKKNKIIIKM